MIMYSSQPFTPLSLSVSSLSNGQTGVLFTDIGEDNSTTASTFDMIADGNFLYISFARYDLGGSIAVLTKLFKYDVTLGTYIFVDTSSPIPTYSNIILTNRNSTTLWATYVLMSGSNFLVRQVVVLKSDLSLSGDVLLFTDGRVEAALIYTPYFTATAISDSSCAFAIYEIANVRSGFMDFICASAVVGISNAPRTVGVVGKGKPFLMGGGWYLPSKMTIGDQELTVLLKYPTGYSIYNRMIPSFVGIYGQTSEVFLTPERTQNRATNESYSKDGIYYFASESVNQSAIVSVGIETNQRNGAIEVGGNLITFGAMTGYFDNVDYSEMGFIGKPFISSANLGAGSLFSDTYQCVAIYTWEDSKKNLFRSAESNTITIVVPAAGGIDLVILHPLITTKENIKVKVYIRASNRLFQLVNTYPISTAIGSPSIYQNPSTFIGTYPSSTAEFLYTEPNAREATTPLNAICMNLYGDRLFYVSNDDKNMVRFSKIKQFNVGFEFPEDFRLQVLDKRGRNEDEITALQAMDGRQLIFKEQSILYIYGQGPADDGSQNDYNDPQLVSTDVGCINQRSVVLTPDGVMFMSQKGIYIVARNLEVSYIGSPVEQFNGLTITSAILADDVNEIRFTSKEGTTLVYNYFSKQWTWWLNMPTNSSCIFNEKQTYLIDDKVAYEDSTNKKLLGDFIEQKISSPWIRLKEIQGYQKAYTLDIVGFYKTSHKMIVNVYYDYEKYTSETYEINPLASSQYNIVTRPTDAELESGEKTNGVYQLRIDLIRKNCEAVRVEITDSSTNFANNSGECFALSNLTFTIGVKNGTYKLPAKKLY